MNIRLWKFLKKNRNQLAELTAAVSLLTERIETMSAELDKLTTQVKANTDAESSAITLLNGLSDQLKSIKDDPVKIAALADELKASSDQLAAAVLSNTPAQPIPPSLAPKKK